eukprot:Clim_evm28s136 gene=Clim_evmTU28s136
MVASGLAGTLLTAGLLASGRTAQAEAAELTADDFETRLQARLDDLTQRYSETFDSPEITMLDLKARERQGIKSHDFAESFEAFLQYTDSLDVPARVKVLALQGVFYNEAGYVDRAEQCFRHGLMHDPGNLACGIRLARLLETKGEYDEAERWYKEMVLRNPGAPPLLYADFLWRVRDDVDTARSMFVAMLAEGSRDSEMYIRAGNFFWEGANDVQHADQVFKAISKHFNQDIKALRAIGNFLRDGGKNPKAALVYHDRACTLFEELVESEKFMPVPLQDDPIFLYADLEKTLKACVPPGGEVPVPLYKIDRKAQEMTERYQRRLRSKRLEIVRVWRKKVNEFVLDQTVTETKPLEAFVPDLPTDPYADIE